MVIRASRSEGDGGGRGAGRNYLSNRRGNRDRKMGEGRKNYGGEAGIVDGKVISCLSYQGYNEGVNRKERIVRGSIWFYALHFGGIDGEVMMVEDKNCLFLDLRFMGVMGEISKTPLVFSADKYQASYWFFFFKKIVKSTGLFLECSCPRG
jgi:hypothetical protein